MNNKSVSTATIGYMGYALSFWLIGVTVAGWAAGTNGSIWAMSFPLSILLLVVGILAVAGDRALDAIVFLAGAALLWSSHALVRIAMAPHGGVTAGFAGWFWIVWSAFYAWVFYAALKGPRVRMLFLLGVTLTFLALAISDWSHHHVLEVVGGYLALATAVLAASISACEINAHGRAGHLKETGSMG